MECSEDKLNSSFGNNTQHGCVQYDGAIFNYINFGILILLLPTILLGNITVLVSVIRFRRLHTCMNLLIANLAAGDLLVAIPAGLLYALMYIHTEFGKNKWLCLAKSTAISTSFTCSLATLAFISVERYLAVFRPLHYKVWLTKKKVKTAITAFWFMLIPISVLPLFVNTWDRTHACDYFELLPRWYGITGFSINLGIFFSTSAILFTLTTCKIRRFQKRVSSLKYNQRRKLSIRLEKDKKAGIMMAFIFLLFVIFWTPFVVMTPMKYILTDRRLIENIKNLTVVIAMANSAVNPIVFCWCKEELRTAMCLLIPCKDTQLQNKNTASEIFSVL